MDGASEAAGPPTTGRVTSPRIAGLTTIVGREDELRDLRAAFCRNRVQVLAGMSGVGKTSIARAYANRHQDDYGVIWWIRAEDPAAIDAEFRALLEVLLPPGQAAQVGDARTVAFNLLAGQGDPWLLVLDNVPDAAAASGLLPPTGDGHVLITSRDPRWPDATVVEPLDADEAILLLGDNDEKAARAVAAELGGLPLALTQAAGFLRTNAISLAAYLHLYRERGAELHADGKPADYPHTVATTWQLAMDRLTDKARELLALIAFYAPESIPVHLLLGKWDELDRHRAIGELCSYGLVSTSADTITVHRLVQAVTRNRLHADQRAAVWAERAHELIIDARPDRPPMAAGALETWVALRPHLLALMAHLPQDDPVTLASRLYVAEWTGESGDANRACELCAELLPIMERVSGPADMATLSTRYALAHWSGMAGRNEQSRDLFAALIPVIERVRGAEHHDTLWTRHQLAHLVGITGDPARARELFVELLGIRERVLGAEHPETLMTRQTLANWTASAGDAVTARNMYAELIPLEERVLGAVHPNTLIARRTLADLVGWDLKDAASARNMYAELLSLHKQALGAEHPKTLGVWEALAWWTAEAGDAELAQTLRAVLLSIQERVLGHEHLDTVRNRQALDLGRRRAAAGGKFWYEGEVPRCQELPGTTWHTGFPVKDEFSKLDHALAAGLISAEDYRARRDKILAKPREDKGMPPGQSPN